MGKMTTYILIMVGLILLFSTFGLIQNTFTSEILQYAFNPEAGSQATLWQFIVNTSADSFNFGLGAIAAAIAAVTTAAGIFFKNDFLVLAPVVAVFVNFGLEFVALYSYFYSILGVVALLIMSPILIVYIFTILEWWRGVST